MEIIPNELQELLNNRKVECYTKYDGKLKDIYIRKLKSNINILANIKYYLEVYNLNYIIVPYIKLYIKNNIKYYQIKILQNNNI